MFAFTHLVAALAIAAGPTTAQEPAATLAARAQKLQRELAALGCPIAEPSAFSLLPAGEYATAVQAEVERMHGAAWIESQRFLRESLGMSNSRSVAETRVHLAQPYSNAYPLYFDAASQTVVVDASRSSALTDTQLIRALVAAHRLAGPAGKSLFSAPERTVENVALDRALLAGEGEVADLALAESRAKRDIKTLVATSLDNPLEATAGDELMRAVHRAGRDFVLQRLQSGGWAGVEAAYSTKPPSCEQLAHALKLGKDLPKRDRLATWDPASGIELVRRDELGELGLMALLVDAGVPSADARVAALGWDGDELQWLRTKDGAHAMVWRIYFDHHNDNRQFAEVLAPRVLGQVIVRGAVVDWVRADTVALSQQLLAALPASKPNTAQDPQDRASTEELERGIRGVQDPRPRLEGGRWVHPRVALSVPAPDRWTVEIVNGQAFLMGPQVGMYRDNIAVAEFALVRGATIDDLLAQQLHFVRADPTTRLETSEKRTIDNREVGFLRYTIQLESGEVNCSTVVYLFDGRPVVVTMSVARANLDRMQRTIDATISGLRFITPRKPSATDSR